MKVLFMTTHKTLAAYLAAIWITLSPSSAIGGDGHDHGEAPATSSGPALPRFTATSEIFELVGVLDGKRLMLYLDRYADGSPVKDARLELELDGTKLSVVPHGEGEFEVEFDKESIPGTHVISAMVIARDESDLLAGELDVHHEDEHSGETSHSHSWQEYAAWVGGAISLLIALLMLARHWRTARQPRLGGAA